MVTSDSGIMIVLSEIQPEKALLSMVMSDGGIVMAKRETQA